MKLVKIALASIVTSALSGLSYAQEDANSDRGWFSRAHIGYSQISDQSVQSSGIGAGDASGDVNLSSGFTSGLSVGYRYNPSWAAEFGWEYRTNDSEVILDNGSSFTEGNYASNTFYLNGHYFFSTPGKWEPYVGAGLVWVQEIDIDLETAGTERSFSDDGYTGFQVFAGANRTLTENWALNLEARYSSIKDIDLDEETGAGRITGLDYEPITLQLGVVYSF